MRTVTLLLLLFTLPFCQTAIAQDKLLLRNGDDLQVKALEISPDSIFFTSLPGSANPKVQAYHKSSVFSITYQNGKVEVMAALSGGNQQTLSDMELYDLGRQDAKKNHSALAAYVGTLGATVILGPAIGLPAGLTTGALLGFTKVPEKYIKPSQPELVDFSSYRTGYIKQAQKKKRTNAIAGFGTAAAAWGVMVIAISAALNK